MRGSTLVVALDGDLRDLSDSAFPDQLALIDLGTPITPRIPEGEARFAVVRTDFEGTAIATLDDDGDVIDEAIIESGRQISGLRTGLSGNVVLADTLGGEPESMLLIDQGDAGILTRLDLTGPTVTGQLNVAPRAADATAAVADVEIVSPESAWMGRFQINIDPATAGLNVTNELVEFDPTSFEFTGQRIDLSALNRAERSGAGDDGLPAPVLAALPNPARNCDEVRPVPETSDLVLVSCRGFAQAIGDAEAQMQATSGVFVVEIDGTDATVVSAFVPSENPAPVFAVVGALPIDASTFVAIERGSEGNAGDRLYAVNIDTGALTLLVESPFFNSISTSMAFDPTAQLLIATDFGDQVVLPFTRESDGRFTPEDQVVFFDDLPYQPLGVYLLR